MKLLSLSAATLVAIAVLLAACGGDDQAATESDATGDFAAAIDAVCTEHALAVNETAEEFGIPRGLEDSGEYEAGRAEAAAAQADAAAALDAPAEGQALVAALQNYAVNYEKIAETAAETDQTGYDAAIERGQGIGNDQIDAAEQLGLEACARKLPAEQEEAVRELTERLLTGADPERSCTEDITDNFRRVSAGRGQRCIDQLTALAEDGATLDYLFTTGVEGVVASANVDFATSSDAAPKYVIYDLLWDEESESWKVDSAFDTGRPPPPADTADPEGSA